MDPVIKTLCSHRSIRRYRRRVIPSKKLREILICGLRASSSGNLNTWSVIVTTQRALLKRLFLLHSKQEMILQAGCVLTFCADFHRTRRWVKLRGAKDAFDDFTSFMVAAVDAVIAAQNVAVAAESSGLGICYMGTTLWSAPGITKILNLPINVVPVTSLVIGYPAENPAPRDRLPLEMLVHRNRYRDPSDNRLLAYYAKREKAGWERYRSMKGVLEDIDRLGIKNLAQYYTSDAKYPKALHRRTSKDYLKLLRRQKFWNH